MQGVVLGVGEPGQRRELQDGCDELVIRDGPGDLVDAPWATVHRMTIAATSVHEVATARTRSALAAGVAAVVLGLF